MKWPKLNLPLAGSLVALLAASFLALSKAQTFTTPAPPADSPPLPPPVELNPAQQVAIFELLNPEVAKINRNRLRTPEQFAKDFVTQSDFLNPLGNQQTILLQFTTTQQSEREVRILEAFLNPVAAKAALDQQKTPAELEREAAAFRAILNPFGRP